MIVGVDLLERRQFECLETEGAFPKAASVVAKIIVYTSLVQATSLAGHILLTCYHRSALFEHLAGGFVVQNGLK